MKTSTIFFLFLVVCSMGGNAMALALPTGKYFYTPYTEPFLPKDVEFSVTEGKSSTVNLPGLPISSLKHHSKDTYLAGETSGFGVVTAKGTIGPALEGYSSEHTISIIPGYTEPISISVKALCDDPDPGTTPTCAKENILGSESYIVPKVGKFIQEDTTITMDYHVVGNYPSDITITNVFGLNRQATFLNSGTMKDIYEKAAIGVDATNLLLSSFSSIKEVTKTALTKFEALMTAFNLAMGKLYEDVPDSVVLDITIGATAALISLGIALSAEVGATAAALTVVASFLAGLALTGLSGVLNKWVKDPPDMKYTEQVILDYASVPKLDLGDSEVAQELETLVNNIVLVSLAESAALDSYEKYQGALLDELQLGLDTSAFQELQKAQTDIFLDQSQLALDQALQAAEMLSSNPEVLSDPDSLNNIQLIKSTLVELENPVPEPSSIALVALGLLSLGLMSRRRVQLST